MPQSASHTLSCPSSRGTSRTGGQVSARFAQLSAAPSLYPSLAGHPCQDPDQLAWAPLATTCQRVMHLAGALDCRLRSGCVLWMLLSQHAEHSPAHCEDSLSIIPACAALWQAITWCTWAAGYHVVHVHRRDLK